MSLLPRLSALPGAEPESIIIGDMAPKDANGGNMTECGRGGNIRLFFIDSTVRLLWGRGGSDTIIP